MHGEAATVGTTATGPIDKRRERLFFSSYAAALAAIIFIGFAPSFYLRGIAPPYAPLRPLRPEVVAHGLLAGAFILFFPLQAWLIAYGKRAWHIAIGRWGFILGLLMVPLGYLVAATNYHSLAGTLPPPFTPALVASAPLFDIAALALLLSLAWRHRYDAQTHKRLMLMMACGLTDPAISRLPLWGSGLSGVLVASSVILATVLPLWAWDLVRRRRIHWATALGSGVLFVKLAVRLLIAPSAIWASFVAALPGFGTP